MKFRFSLFENLVVYFENRVMALARKGVGEERLLSMMEARERKKERDKLPDFVPFVLIGDELIDQVKKTCLK